MSPRRPVPLPLILLTLPALAAGCLPCCGAVSGDPKAPIELEPAVYRPGQGYVVPDAGEQVPLVVGGQGGFMIVTGVRARNLDGCGATIDARLVSLDGGEVAGSDSALRDLRVGEDGFAEVNDEDGSRGAFVRICNGSGSPNVDQPWRLEVTLTDRDGRTARASREIVPTCPPDFGSWCPYACGVPDAGIQ